MPGSLLVNFVYCHPVGHAIEALHYCHGYHAADPDLRISVALNADTPVELARLCPFVDQVYPVHVDLVDARFDPTAQVAAIPADFDHVVDDPRGHQPAQRAVFPALARYYDACARRFASARPLGFAGAAPPDYTPGLPFRLPITPARPEGGGPVIAVLPAGSGPRAHYPSQASWLRILDVLARRFTGARFVVVGKARADRRTRSSLSRAEFDELLAACDGIDIVDTPLTDQLSTVAGCDVLVSPHSGFGMAALAVGTPWLSIAGNRWPEYYFNGVPFYSVMPDINRFPCYTLLDADPPMVSDDGPRSPSMCARRITEDLPAIVEGVARLVEGRWDYPTALADHFDRLLRLREGSPEGIWSVDGLHRR